MADRKKRVIWFDQLTDNVVAHWQLKIEYAVRFRDLP